MLVSDERYGREWEKVPFGFLFHYPNLGTFSVSVFHGPARTQELNRKVRKEHLAKFAKKFKLSRCP
jgi:hypothetical protein